MKIKRRLIIDVTYEADEMDGTTIAALEANLDYVAMHASLNGLLTDGTDAEVAEWDCTVEDI